MSYVYFFQIGHDGPVKIGHTERDISVRLDEWQRLIPMPIHFLGKIEANKDREDFLKEYFEDLRIMPASGFMSKKIRRTEWFEPADELLDYIENIADPNLKPELVVV
jgi:hypothetical protein